MTGFCPEHSGNCEALKTMQKLQEDMREPGGTIERVYGEINKRVSWSVFALLCVLGSGIIGTTFVQLYQMQKETLSLVQQVQIAQAAMGAQLARIDKVVNHRGQYPMNQVVQEAPSK